MSRSSSSSSNESKQRESSASSDHYVPVKSFRKSSKYPKKVSSHEINPKSSKNARSNRIDSDSSSWRIKTPKSESEDEEEKMENRPRLRSIVISKAALNNNNNNATSSSYSSSSSSSLNFKSNQISNSKYRINDSCSSE